MRTWIITSLKEAFEAERSCIPMKRALARGWIDAHCGEDPTEWPQFDSPYLKSFYEEGWLQGALNQPEGRAV